MPDTAEYQREYYLKNRDALKAKMRSYYQKNKEVLIQKMREYQEDHREQVAFWQNQYHKQRRIEHPEIYRAAKHNRRAMVASCGGTYRPSDLEKLNDLQGGRCAACGLKFKIGSPYVVDHVIPIALKGRNVIDNLQLLCRPCNRAKWHMHPDKWAQRLGKLFV